MSAKSSKDLSAAPRRGAGSVSATQNVYKQLRQQIVALDLPPGTVLSRSDLATGYGVSQTPVREALQLLEQDGLVRIFPQSKTVVRRIDVRQLNETHFLRVAVECEVVRQLASSPKPEVTKRARAIVQMQKALQGELDQADMFNELDQNFHLTLFEGLDVGNLQNLLTSKLGHLQRCQRLDLPKEGKMARIVEDHTNILDFIEAGDAEAASQATRVHLSGTISRVDELQKEHPTFFTDESA